MTTAPLIDRIYEAAFIPELWAGVLDNLAVGSGSVSGSILIFRGLDTPPLYRSTPLTEPSLHAFTTTDQWRESRRVPFLFPDAIAGKLSHFFYARDLMPPDELEEDTVERNLRRLGLGEQITTVIPMPTGEVASFTLEREANQGRHLSSAVEHLDSIRPHLARSALISARLRLERAVATVTALDAIGLPAAILSAGGRVLTSNSLLEGMATIFLPTAFGGLAIADVPANRLFRDAVAGIGSDNRSVVRSIPVKPAGDRMPMVIHVLPVRRAAQDIFSGADLLLVATEMKTDGSLPAPRLLAALFDLTPSEARLAVALAAGKPLRQAALDMGIGFGSARTYLSRIFSKTGTNQQSQLVALLKSTQPMLP